MRGAPLLVLLLSIAALGPALTLGPTAAQESPDAGGALVVTDPIGDVGPLGVGVDGNPAMAAYQHIDIAAVEFGPDTTDSFPVRLKVAGWDETVTAPAQALALSDFRCYLSWTYADPPEGTSYSYTLRVWADLLRTPGSPEQASSLMTMSYFDREEYYGHYSASVQNIPPTRFDAATSSFVTEVPKTFAPVWPSGQIPHKGDTLVFQYADCYTDVAGRVSMVDSLAGSTTDTYAMRSDGPGNIVNIRFADQPDPLNATGVGSWQFPTEIQTAPTATVAPGTATVLPVVLWNRAESRKLVELDVLGVPDGWNLTIVPNVFLSPNEQRTVNLIVTPAPGAAIGTAHRIDVRGQAIGEDERALAARILKVMPGLGPDHNTFHVHVRPVEHTDPLSQAMASTLVYDNDVEISLLDQLEGFSNAPAPVHAASGWSDHSVLDPLVRPLRLDAEVPVTATVAMQGDPARDVNVEMMLYAQDFGIVFRIDEEVPGDGTTQLSATIPADEILVLPAGTRLVFVMGVGPSGYGIENANDVALDPTGTSFTLPILDDSQDMVVSDGRYLPTLALARDEDRTTYINPGKEYAFDLVLANEGVETDDLRVVVNGTNATGWHVEIEPGHLFRVAPGNSTPVSVVVRAPASAAEGDHPRFEVIAQSKHDQVARTKIVLDAIVTTGVEIESKGYTAKKNELQPLAEDAEESPASGLAAVLVGLAVLALRRRR